AETGEFGSQFVVVRDGDGCKPKGARTVCFLFQHDAFINIRQRQLHSGQNSATAILNDSGDRSSLNRLCSCRQGISRQEDEYERTAGNNSVSGEGGNLNYSRGESF